MKEKYANFRSAEIMEVATAYKNPTISTHSVLKLLYGKEKRL